MLGSIVVVLYTYRPGPVLTHVVTSNLLLYLSVIGCMDTPGKNAPV